MLKTYDFKEVAVTFGGRIITGFADGDAVAVELNEDEWTLQVGAEGEATRSKSNNNSAKVTIRLQQASESNAVLNAFAMADKLKNSGAQPFFMKTGGGSVYSCLAAWVVKRPAAPYAAEAGVREWVLETDSMDILENGN